jgi:hypothetical protein
MVTATPSLFAHLDAGPTLDVAEAVGFCTHVLLGDGNGGLGPPSLNAFASHGDVTRDGRVDLVTGGTEPVPGPRAAWVPPERVGAGPAVEPVVARPAQDDVVTARGLHDVVSAQPGRQLQDARCCS